MLGRVHGRQVRPRASLLRPSTSRLGKQYVLLEIRSLARGLTLARRGSAFPNPSRGRVSAGTLLLSEAATGSPPVQWWRGREAGLQVAQSRVRHLGRPNQRVRIHEIRFYCHGEPRSAHLPAAPACLRRRWSADDGAHRRHRGESHRGRPFEGQLGCEPLREKGPVVEASHPPLPGRRRCLWLGGLSPAAAEGALGARSRREASMGVALGA